jgi:hypothetical protein
MEGNKIEKVTVEKVKTGLKWCSRCGMFKPLSEFRDHGCTYDGKQKWCRNCEYKKAKKESKIKSAKMKIKFILKELTVEEKIDIMNDILLL